VRVRQIASGIRTLTGSLPRGRPRRSIRRSRPALARQGTLTFLIATLLVLTSESSARADSRAETVIETAKGFGRSTLPKPSRRIPYCALRGIAFGYRSGRYTKEPGRMAFSVTTAFAVSSAPSRQRSIDSELKRQSLPTLNAGIFRFLSIR
jgi:hypothetical protein